MAIVEKFDIGKETLLCNERRWFRSWWSFKVPKPGKSHDYHGRWGKGSV